MTSADSYIFWCAPTTDEEDVGFEDEIPVEENQTAEVDPEGKGKARESMYVSLVETMVKTVLEGEDFLFSTEELAFFTAYSKLSYKARYLLARLLIRKTGKWIRLDQLKYVSELGNEGIVEAMKELCASQYISNGPGHSSIGLELIDLVSDDEGRAGFATPSSQAGPSSDMKPFFGYYAEDETFASMLDLLKCLTVEELKGLARTLKLPNNLTTRNALVDTLLASASIQTTLGRFSSPVNSAKSRKSGRDLKSSQLKQTFLSFKPVNQVKVQTDVLRGLILKILRKCIRVNDAINALFHRLHIIYFRSTQHPTSLLTPALLRRCRKRYYPLYYYVRTPEIFTSRDELIAYEEALRMEAAVDLMLEGNIDVELAQSHVDSWANLREKEAAADLLPPHTLRSLADSSEDDFGDEKENQSRTVPARARSTSVPVKIELDDKEPVAPLKESQAVSNARYVVSVFERVYPRWKELVRQRGEQDARPRGLERFDEGYILTRIVYKGEYRAAAYGKLGNFNREIELLQELLAQKRWRRGKRGAWYDRWALVLMHHLVREKQEVDGEQQPLSKDKQKNILKKALDVVIEGLHDDDTHIVNRQALEHRLSRLEKRLKVPAKERHKCAGKLQKATEATIIGERIQQRKSSVANDKTSKIVNKAIIPVSVQIQGEQAVRRHLDQMKKDLQKTKERWTGKSLWYGKTGEEVNVETLVLQHYELEGFKGFHSEASIVSTIWGLLFWDILFSAVPGAFETPYQSAPLDIATECFFFTRKDVIEERLKEIKDGKAAEILAATDDKYRENNTMCVGVRWNDFSKQDLVEIVTCLGGEGLSVVCRLFCEDYGARHSGIPDLIVWRMQDKMAKFVEVKGPGDNLSENQKVWIDVLLRSGVNVEVRRVIERVKAGANPMRNAPKKHRVIRVYRIDEGQKDIPINVDEDEDGKVESEEELEEVEEGHPRKRQRTEELAGPNARDTVREEPLHDCSLVASCSI